MFRLLICISFLQMLKLADTVTELSGSVSVSQQDNAADVFQEEK